MYVCVCVCIYLCVGCYLGVSVAGVCGDACEFARAFVSCELSFLFCSLLLVAPAGVLCNGSLLSGAPLDARDCLSVWNCPTLTGGPLRGLADVPLAADWLFARRPTPAKRPAGPARAGLRKQTCPVPKNCVDRRERRSTQKMWAHARRKMISRFSPARRGRRGGREGSRTA